jgi:hypothetical protein
MMLEEVRSELAKPVSDLHDTLLACVKNRVRAASSRWGQRHEQWRANEKLYRAFREPDADDKRTRSTSKSLGVEKIVVPYTYAQIQSILAFLVTIFTDRKPIIPVEPVGDYFNQAIVHELMLQYQYDHMLPRGILVWIQLFLDALRYDVGVVKNAWLIREWCDIKRVVIPSADGKSVIDEVIEEDIVAYEGNEMVNVSPFDFYPDPNFHISDFQRGEFVAHKMKVGKTYLKTKEKEGLYTGIEFIPRTNTGQSQLSSLTSTGPSANPETVGMTKDNIGAYIDEYDIGSVTLHEMWWFCPPGELGLPTTRTDDMPTLWVFTMANENRIIRAEAANLPGRRFPFSTIQCNYDVHSPTTPSMVETTAGLNYWLNFLYNSRAAAVRKTLNNEVVLDPSVIETADYEGGNESGIWRITKDYYGAGAARDAVMPLPVQDVTSGHLRYDAPYSMELMDTITGASRLVQGLGNSGRRAATEVQAQISLSSGRMKLMGAIFGCGLSDLCEMQIANTQTFFGQRLQLPVNQAYQDIMKANMVDITPDLLQGTFRVPFLESGIPTDKAFHANMLREVLTLWMQSGGGAPGTPSAAINGLEILMALLRTVGIQNIKDFIVPSAILQAQQMQMQVMPDQQVQDQVQQGNLVPSTQEVTNQDGSPQGPGEGDNGIR